jgi:hypothetical protein
MGFWEQSFSIGEDYDKVIHYLQCSSSWPWMYWVFLSPKLKVGLLQPLSTRNLQHRVSFYADEGSLPPANIRRYFYHYGHLQILGEASELRNNVQKCSVFSIQCNENEWSIRFSVPIFGTTSLIKKAHKGSAATYY